MISAMEFQVSGLVPGQGQFPGQISGQVSGQFPVTILVPGQCSRSEIQDWDPGLGEQVWVPVLGYGSVFQVWVPGLGSRCGIQVCIPGLGSRFQVRFQIRFQVCNPGQGSRSGVPSLVFQVWVSGQVPGLGFRYGSSVCGRNSSSMFFWWLVFFNN